MRKLYLYLGVLLIVVILVAVVATYGNYRFWSGKTRDDSRNITLGVGQTYNVVAGTFNPHHVIKYRNLSYTFDLSKPEELLDALWSTSNRYPQKYLSLLDPAAQEKVKRVDNETGGEILAPSSRDEPFPTPAELTTIFTNWTQVVVNNKTYRIIYGRQIVNGRDYNTLTLVIVKEGDGWLQSFDLENTPLLRKVMSKKR
jgi:hypothetical protein